MKAFAELGRMTGTAIFFVPARTLEKVLAEIGLAIPGATVVVARELTKLHEEFVRGSPEACAAAFSGRTPRGEVTLLVSPPRDREDRPVE